MDDLFMKLNELAAHMHWRVQTIDNNQEAREEIADLEKRLSKILMDVSRERSLSTCPICTGAGTIG